MMLAGRTILVTGAARGLGREIALACARQGARLVLADIDAARGAETCALVAGTGAEARFLPVDLASPESIAALAEDIAAREGSLHGLANNAALATDVGGMGFEEIELDLWDRVMRINVRGTWLMIRACAPMLRTSGSGRVVNVASDTALWGAPRLLSYTASKGAVIAMTRSLARELGPDRVGVTCVAPGILTTESTDYVPEARHRLYSEGRAVPGPQGADEITGTIAFLLSDAALTLTGQVLPVNNGFVFT